MTKMLVVIGAACLKFHDETMRDLPCKRSQADEIWSFVYTKQKNVTINGLNRVAAARGLWTWTAICADTKPICGCARDFTEETAGRLTNRVHRTTDGHKAYPAAVDRAFGNDIDYAMLIELYGDSPDSDHISTSYAERQNLTIRISMRRFTRLTNGFSKKIENQAAATALYFTYYNFGPKQLKLTHYRQPRGPLHADAADTRVSGLTWWVTRANTQITATFIAFQDPEISE